MANYLILEQNYVQNGLGTLTFNVTDDGLYTVQAQVTVIPESSLVILVKQNGVTKYTAPTFTPTQEALQFKTTLKCVDTDVVTVVLSSSADIDNEKNSVKSNISISLGE